jgi:hypothetical protein
MPIVGTSAYNTAGQVTSLVRALLNDAQGNLFTDGLLMPFLNAAYRKTQRALANVGAGTFIVDNVIVTVPAVAGADPSLQVVISDSVAPPNQLPTDLLVPVKLWERAAGSGDDFAEMADLTAHGGLPSRPQGAALDCWEWRGDGIYLCGALADREVRIRYQRAYPDLSDAQSPILVRNAQDALAFLAAAMAAMSRGSPLADKWAAAGDDAIEDLVRAATRREQHTIRRRRPFSSRRGYAWT